MSMSSDILEYTPPQTGPSRPDTSKPEVPIPIHSSTSHSEASIPQKFSEIEDHLDLITPMQDVHDPPPLTCTTYDCHHLCKSLRYL